MNQYKTLYGFLSNIENIGNKRAYNGLVNSKDLLHLSKELVTIELNVPVELHVNELKRQQMDIQLLTELFTKWELYSLIPQIESVTKTISVPENVSKQYSTVLTNEELKTMISQLKESPIISFDIETTFLNALEADIVGLSFSIEENKGWYIPIVYPEKQNQSLFDEFSLEVILKELTPLFLDDHVKFCGQNIKYDALVLSRYGIDLNGIEFDTMVAAHLIRPESSRFKIDYLSLEFLNYQMVPITDLIGTGKNQISMADVPIDDITFYALEDADVALQLTHLFPDR